MQRRSTLSLKKKSWYIASNLEDMKLGTRDQEESRKLKTERFKERRGRALETQEGSNSKRKVKSTLN